MIGTQMFGYKSEYRCVWSRRTCVRASCVPGDLFKLLFPMTTFPAGNPLFEPMEKNNKNLQITGLQRSAIFPPIDDFVIAPVKFDVPITSGHINFFA